MQIPNLLVLFFLSLLAAIAFSIPTEKGTCEQYGKSTGCSGCSSDKVDCEWCVSADNDANGLCAIAGTCDTYTADSKPRVSGKHLCPTDPNKEPHYKGSLLYTGLFSSRLQEGLFSSNFDSHYCEFPTEPYPVDRSSNALGNSDPRGNCQLVNSELITGQRGALDACLESRAAKKRATEGGAVPVELLTRKRKECLRLWNSMACTISCPKYGTAVDFTNLCPEFCERYEQHCDEDMQYCLEQEGRIDLESYFDCAAPDAPKCSRPELIETSGQFEYDLCFFGNPARCTERPLVDCKVELATSQAWPSYFTSAQDQTGFESTQMGPACNPNGAPISTLLIPQPFFVLYRTETPPSGGALCNSALESNLISDFPGSVSGSSCVFVDSACTPDFDTIGGYCAVLIQLPPAYLGGLPVGVNTPGDTQNCPGRLMSPP